MVLVVVVVAAVRLLWLGRQMDGQIIRFFGQSAGRRWGRRHAFAHVGDVLDGHQHVREDVVEFTIAIFCSAERTKMKT